LKLTNYTNLHIYNGGWNLPLSSSRSKKQLIIDLANEYTKDFILAKSKFTLIITTEKIEKKLEILK
jgi:hypothetical protein